MVLKLILTVEATVASMLQGAMAELNQTSRGKHLKEATGEQVSCLHPLSSRLRRGNKFGKWTVCGVCKLRMTYDDLGKAKGAAAKAEVSEKNEKQKAKEKTTKEDRPVPTAAPPRTSPQSSAPAPAPTAASAASMPSATEELLLRMCQAMAQQIVAPLSGSMEAIAAQALQSNTRLEALADLVATSAITAQHERTQYYHVGDPSGAEAEPPGWEEDASMVG